MKIKLKNLKENSFMELFSVDGIRIFSNIIQPQIGEIDIPHLSKGNYILRIKNKHSVATMKLNRL